MSDLVQNLLDLDGVQSVHIKKEVVVTHRRRNTGEVDDVFNEIRERVVSEDEFQTVANFHDWHYLGTIDVVGDFQLRDKFTKSYEMEANNE